MSALLFLYRQVLGHKMPWLDDIRTVQELLGHKDVSMTMIYTHVMNNGERGVRSPLDHAEQRRAEYRATMKINPRTSAFLRGLISEACRCPGNQSKA